MYCIHFSLPLFPIFFFKETFFYIYKRGNEVLWSLQRTYYLYQRWWNCFCLIIFDILQIFAKFFMGIKKIHRALSLDDKETVFSKGKTIVLPFENTVSLSSRDRALWIFLIPMKNFANICKMSKIIRQKQFHHLWYK